MTFSFKSLALNNINWQVVNLFFGLDHSRSKGDACALTPYKQSPGNIRSVTYVLEKTLNIQIIVGIRDLILCEKKSV